MDSNFENSNTEMDKAKSDRDMLRECDCFELLSAYLDGEVTAGEKKQVEEWLVSDPKIQHLHKRLLQIRQRMQSMPIPTPEVTAAQLSDRVFRRVRQRRLKRIAVWGGGAVAAVLVGAVSLLLPRSNTLVPQLAQSSPPTEKDSEPLMIAVNQPVVPIPNAVPVVSPQKRPN
jgi:anti-sigma factor RsiW